MTRLYSLEPTPASAILLWLFPGLVPESDLLLLDGPAGVGKTMLLSAFASTMSIMDGAQGSGGVLVLASPDQRDSFIAFLNRHHPSHNRVHGIDFNPTDLPAEHTGSLVQPILQCIEASLAEHHPRMLIIDSLEEWLDLGTPPDTRDLLHLWKHLRILARTHSCAIVVSRRHGFHENRAYGAFTRLGSEQTHFALTIHWHPNDAARRVITLARNQHGPAGIQCHFVFNRDGAFCPDYLDQHQYVRPSSSMQTWQPDPPRQEETQDIMEAVERCLQGRPTPTHIVRNYLQQAGYPITAIKLALRYARLRTIRIGEDTCYLPTENMMLRRFEQQHFTSPTPSRDEKVLDPQKPPENQARAHTEQPCTLASPPSPPVARQAG